MGTLKRKRDPIASINDLGEEESKLQKLVTLKHMNDARSHSNSNLKLLRSEASNGVAITNMKLGGSDQESSTIPFGE